MLRDGRAVGAILVRAEASAFSDKQIELLKTFADQAVIAIENVRLFTELRRRTASCDGARHSRRRRARSCASSASSPTDVQPVFDAIVASAVTLCGATSTVRVIGVDGDLIALAAHHESSPPSALEAEGGLSLPAVEAAVARAILDAVQFTCPDHRPTTRASSGTAPTRTRVGYRSVVAVPLLREGEPIGAIARPPPSRRPVHRQRRSRSSRPSPTRRSSPSRTCGCSRSWRKRNGSAYETLDQQTATSEILRVISQLADGGPAGVRRRRRERHAPVRARPISRICRLVRRRTAASRAHHGPIPCARARCGEFTLPLSLAVRSLADRFWSAGRFTSLTCRPTSEYSREQRERAAHGLTGRILGVPLLRDGVAIGIDHSADRGAAVHRAADRPAPDLRRPGGHRDRERAAVHGAPGEESAADPAHAQVTEALDQQTATSEILRVISQLPDGRAASLRRDRARARCGSVAARFRHATRFDGELASPGR